MKVLRLRCPLSNSPLQCEWQLSAGARSGGGAGGVDDVPRDAERIEWIVPASDVSITRVKLPRAARRREGAVLAYAVEDEIAGEADAQYVTRLGRVGDEDVLAVLESASYARALDAFARAGIAPDAIYCETLLLPRAPGAWSIAWDGREGFVRTDVLDGAATDAGDFRTPPLTLRLMLESARARGALPQELALYITDAEAAPDLDAWQAALGIPLLLAGAWDWRIAPTTPHAQLMRPKRGLNGLGRIAPRLAAAAWLVAVALAVHAAGLAIDWAMLASDERALESRMEARFRAVFPEALAIADPALQMRRKLAESRRAIGHADPQDFLPMLGRVVVGVKELPPGALRVVAYDDTRLTLHVRGAGEAALQRFGERLREGGLQVTLGAGGQADGNAVLTVREGS